MPLWRRAAPAGLVAIVALIVMAFAPSVATADPWACDNAGYLTQFDGLNPAEGTAFRRADRQPNDTYQLTTLGTEPAEHLNAIGFRAQDGLVYAWNNTTQEVTRIERDPITDEPTFEDIGNPLGSGITSTVIGAVLADGTYMVWQGGNPEVGAIFDVSGPEAELVSTVTLNPASPDGFRGDFAVSPVDGQIYGVNPDNPDDPNTTWGVYRFTLEGGVLTRGPRVGAGTAAAGAAWFQPDNTFIIYTNGPNGLPPQGNGVYGIDLASGQMRFLGSGPGFSNADGAACANGIALTKDASPRTVTAGAELTYSYTLTSRGLTDNPMTFVDALPAGMTYVPGGVTVTPSFGAVNDYGGTDTLSISGTMSPNQSVTITARVRVSPDHSCDANVDNQAEATMEAPGLPPVTVLSNDPQTPDDPTDPTAVHVDCSADLSIDKRAATAPLVPGEEATFTLVATNNGPSTARNMRVSDQLPAELSFLSASQGCAAANGTLTCSVASLAPGASQTFSVTGTVAPSLDHCLENTATVTSDTPDPNLANNSSTICEPINGRSDLSIRKVPSRTEVGAGGQVMFTLVVRNHGPTDNPGVEISDPLAAGLTLVSAKPSQGSCATDANRLGCDLGRLKVGGSLQVLVTAQVSGSECVTNTAHVRGALVDPKPANNQDGARVCPTPDPDPNFDLAVSKSANDRRVLAGQTVRYRVVVRNQGPDAAPGVELTDTLNAPVRVMAVRASQGSCGKGIPMRCELGEIGARKRVTITIRAKHREAGCRQVNTVSATGAGTDVKPVNNLSRVGVCVAPKIRIVKTADRKSVQAGGIVKYTIRVTNLSKGVAAQDVRTCDRLPSGLALVGAKPKAKLSKGMPCWTRSVLKGRRSAVYRLTAKVLRSAGGRERNVATASVAGSRSEVTSDDAVVRVQGRQPRPTPVTG